MLERVKLRLEGETVSDEVLSELIQTITDRLILRLGASDLPETFNSIVVDATVKMYRRLYYEGISSENVSNLSTSFIEDILNEYSSEISTWKEQQANSGKNKRVVRFI